MNGSLCFTMALGWGKDWDEGKDCECSVRWEEIPKSNMALGQAYKRIHLLSHDHKVSEGRYETPLETHAIKEFG